MYTGQNDGQLRQRLAEIRRQLKRMPASHPEFDQLCFEEEDLDEYLNPDMSHLNWLMSECPDSLD